MADHFDPAKFGAIMQFGPFTAANCTTGHSNADLAFGQQSYAVMPKAGSVVGISACVNAAVTAGSITVRAHSASTELGDQSYPAPVINATNTASYASTRPGAVTFAAGARLGLSIVSTTTLNPTDSLEIDAFLFVALDPN